MRCDMLDERERDVYLFILLMEEEDHLREKEGEKGWNKEINEKAFSPIFRKEECSS